VPCQPRLLANVPFTQRKQARQRRDYLYRRALTLRDAEISEKRSKLRASLASGKPLDASIANDKTLRKDYAYDESREDRTVTESLDLDDEYSNLSGIQDPRILVTTSRDPSARLGAFAKVINATFRHPARLCPRSNKVMLTPDPNRRSGSCFQLRSA
jgi:U3 small nucleolar ribonucleoprotein protein IMP4